MIVIIIFAAASVFLTVGKIVRARQAAAARADECPPTWRDGEAQ